jgi:thymidine phosphorylase
VLAIPGATVSERRPHPRIDCLEVARVAKRAGAPANAAAGARLLRTVGDVDSRGEPLFEIHAQSAAQLEFACAYARERVDRIRFGS